MLKYLASALILTACGTAFAADTTPKDAATLPEMKVAQEAIKAKEWAKAIDNLESVLRADRFSADANSLMGFALRNSGKWDQSFRYYNEALRLDAKHIGAHEYIGQAYLQRGNVIKAEEHLTKLTAICGTCDEAKSLATALADAKKNPK